MSVSLIAPDGTRSCAGERGTLKGRGNSTWNCPKKPYLLTFSEPQTLLGMGAAEKWVLLANAIDETELRDRLIYTLASKTGLEWTPQCRYVELYLNGEYAGLYLLTEKVEAGENRLNLSDGDFLCVLEVPEIVDARDNAFTTEFGRTVEICAPKNLTREQQNRMEAETQRMEDAILSGDPSDPWPDCLDLDSWVRKYMVDEIAANVDADRSSSYFYCRHTDGDPKFFAGPVWDYDAGLGRYMTNADPRTFVANTPWNRRNRSTPYFHALYQREAFRERLAELYREEFLPILQEMIAGGIQTEEDRVSGAIYMDHLRWQNGAAVNGAEELRAYLEARVEFLSEAWLDGAEFYTVQVEIYEPSSDLMQYTVRPGERLPALPYVERPKHGPAVWIDLETGEAFDPEQPVERDMTLFLDNASLLKTSPYLFIRKHIIPCFCYASLGLTVAVLLWLVLADCRGNANRKRYTDRTRPAIPGRPSEGRKEE